MATQVITKQDAQEPVDTEAAQAAAEAAFAAVDEPTEKPVEPKVAVPEKTEVELAAETKAAEDAAAKAAAEAEWEGVPAKVRQTLEAISGKVGAIDELSHIVKSQDGRVGAALAGVNALRTAMDAAKAVTNAGGEAPSQAQISAAASSDEEWKKLLEDFPEWESGIDKRIDYRMEARLSKLALPPAIDVVGLKTELTGTVGAIIAKATSEAKAEARELAKIDRKYENWEDLIGMPPDANGNRAARPEFIAWYNTQAPEIQALSASDRAADAIRMMDAYTEHRKAVAEATAKAAKNKARLDAAITPKGVAAPGQRSLSDREAAERAFAAVDNQ